MTAVIITILDHTEFQFTALLMHQVFLVSPDIKQGQTNLQTEDKREMLYTGIVSLARVRVNMTSYQQLLA